MKLTNKLIITLTLLCMNMAVFAFDDGFVFGMKARFSGSHTLPHISDADKDNLHVQAVKGLTGFIMDGEFEFGYIFDSPTYFNKKNNNIFGGLELDGFIGVGQGFSGQKTTAEGLDTFLNIYFTPTVRFGAKLKTHLFHNRFSVVFGLGGRMIADPNPEYMAYSKPGEPLENGMEVGTIIVTPEDMKRMNPFGALLECGLEYTQPIITTMELSIGGYMSYTIYKPGGATMPASLKKAFVDTYSKEPPKVLKSYFLNSLDFGLTIGLRLKA